MAGEMLLNAQEFNSVPDDFIIHAVLVMIFFSIRVLCSTLSMVTAREKGNWISSSV